MSIVATMGGSSAFFIQEFLRKRILRKMKEEHEFNNRIITF